MEIRNHIVAIDISFPLYPGKHLHTRACASGKERKQKSTSYSHTSFFILCELRVYVCVTYTCCLDAECQRERGKQTETFPLNKIHVNV